MSRRLSARTLQTSYDGEAAPYVSTSPLPPRYTKHGRRKRRPPRKSSPFLTIILLAFLSMIISLIVLSFLEINI